MGESQRIAVLGTPSRPDIEWSAENLAALVAAGFTSVQLNIAWSYRPMDEPLNLEDVWRVEGSVESSAAPGGLEKRQADLRNRSRAAHEAGLGTLFHFGAPNQGRAGFDGVALPQCVSDPATGERYARALVAFGEAFDDVDDLLVYTYDQNAWLCSEFDSCERCSGVPLHERLPTFLNRLAGAWASVRPQGRTWWEPWELSAGQALACIPKLDPAQLGLMLHSSIAEVITTIAGDRFFRNAASLAAQHGLPVVGEVFLSSSNEEVEPWCDLPTPLVTVRQLRDVERVDGVTGVKEYFGIVPSDFDVNLLAASTYFADPEIGDADLLTVLADRFESPWLADFWTLTSSAYEYLPWDASWFARQFGRSHPQHELSAASVRGMQSNASQWDTPAWRSSRGSIFMRTTNDEPHPWLLEDVGLRFATAAGVMEQAVDLFVAEFASSETPRAERMRAQVSEAIGFITRARAYASHIRESLLTSQIRAGSPRHGQLWAELREVLVADLANQVREGERAADSGSRQTAPSELQLAERWVVERRAATTDIENAIALLDADPGSFLATYFLPASDLAAAGQFSLTSR